MAWERCGRSSFYRRAEAPWRTVFLDPVDLVRVSTRPRKAGLLRKEIWVERTAVGTMHPSYIPMVLEGPEGEVMEAWAQHVLASRREGTGWITALLDDLDVDLAGRDPLLDAVALYVSEFSGKMMEEIHGKVLVVPEKGDLVRTALRSLGVPPCA